MVSLKYCGRAQDWICIPTHTHMSTCMRRLVCNGAHHSPCSGGRSILHWGFQGEEGWGSGCGRRRGKCHSIAAPLHPCTPGRTQCGGHLLPPPLHPSCLPHLPLRPQRDHPWPPTESPPSPGGRITDGGRWCECVRGRKVGGGRQAGKVCGTEWKEKKGGVWGYFQERQEGWCGGALRACACYGVEQ